MCVNRLPGELSLVPAHTNITSACAGEAAGLRVSGTCTMQEPDVSLTFLLAQTRFLTLAAHVFSPRQKHLAEENSPHYGGRKEDREGRSQKQCDNLIGK